MSSDVIIGHDGKPRCSWVGAGDTALARYHDEVWGARTYDECAMIEALTLGVFEALEVGGVPLRGACGRLRFLAERRRRKGPRPWVLPGSRLPRCGPERLNCACPISGFSANRRQLLLQRSGSCRAATVGLGRGRGGGGGT